jgi:hypothetical protein
VNEELCVQRAELERHSKAGLGNVDAIVAKSLLNMAKTREPRCRSILLTGGHGPTAGPSTHVEPLPSPVPSTGDVTPMSAIPMASTPVSGGSSGRKRLRGDLVQTPQSSIPALAGADGMGRGTPADDDDMFQGEDFAAIGSDWEALCGGEQGFWLDSDDGAHPVVGTPTLHTPDTPYGFILSTNPSHVRRSMNV